MGGNGRVEVNHPSTQEPMIDWLTNQQVKPMYHGMILILKKKSGVTYNIFIYFFAMDFGPECPMWNMKPC